MNTITGKVWNFGANIDTDVIIAARYLNSSDPEHLAKYVMEDADPEFPKKLKKGDIIVAGENFGCGSSREHAPIALSKTGIKAILAPSFARIFYRNSIDGGYLLPIEIEEKVLSKIDNKDKIEINLEYNQITNLTKNETYKIKPFSKIISGIIEAGGLFNYKS